MFKTLFYISYVFGLLHSIQAQCGTPSPTTASGTYAPTGPICSGDLIFEDNFDELNLQKWQHELTLAGGGNWEFQWYTNSRYNSYVENGHLVIRPTLVADETGEDFLSSGTVDLSGGSPADECTDPSNYGCIRTGAPDALLNPIKSARMRTVNSFSFKYGKVEVRAKAPRGDWLWPAIWMLPRWNQYSSWPISGEIDIMECRGNAGLIDSWGTNIGVQQMGQTMHWGPNYMVNKFMLTHVEKQNPAGWDTDFHNYQFIWNENNMQFAVDDEVLMTVEPPEGGFWEMGNLDESGYENPWKRSYSKLAPFDQEYYIILNLAVGGVNYFPDDATNPGGKPWANDSPNAVTDFWHGKDQWLTTWALEGTTAEFQIDYVRVWAL